MRLDKFLLLCLSLGASSFLLRAFSNSVSLSSIMEGAGGGCQFVFFYRFVFRNLTWYLGHRFGENGAF